MIYLKQSHHSCAIFDIKTQPLEQSGKPFAGDTQVAIDIQDPTQQVSNIGDGLLPSCHSETAPPMSTMPQN